MKKRKKDTKWMVMVALMAAIVIILANTPLGMIQLPIVKATTVHIPVILGAIVLGPMAGAILGITFGVCSVISNTMAPTLLSFAFSPFLSTTGLVGAAKALWISVGCRMMIGIFAGWLWIFLKWICTNHHLDEITNEEEKKTQTKKQKKRINVALLLTGFVTSMFHTVIVMGSIYLLLAQQYAEAKDVAVTSVFGLVLGTVLASGIPEAIAAAILVFAIGKVLLTIYRQ